MTLSKKELEDYLPGWQQVGAKADGSHPLFDSGCK